MKRPIRGPLDSICNVYVSDKNAFLIKPLFCSYKYPYNGVPVLKLLALSVLFFLSPLFEWYQHLLNYNGLS